MILYKILLLVTPAQGTHGKICRSGQAEGLFSVANVSQTVTFEVQTFCSSRLDRSLAGLSAGHKLSGVFFVQTVVLACFNRMACSVCVQWLADGVRPFSAPLTCCSRALLWPSARWMGIPARRRRGGVSSQKRPTARSAAEVAGGHRGLVTVT